jgi:hypothetical protein
MECSDGEGWNQLPVQLGGGSVLIGEASNKKVPSWKIRGLGF